MMFQNREANLLNKTTAGEAIETDRSIYKIIVLAILGIIFSFIFGYFLKLFILDSRLDFFLFSSLGAIGFLTVFLLDAFFIKNGVWISQIIFLESLAFLAGTFSAPFDSFSMAEFYNRSSMNIAIGALVSFSVLLWANHNGRLELEDMLKIRFWRICKKIFQKAIAALALFVSVVYVNIGIGVVGEKDFFISQSSFEKIFFSDFSIKIIQNFLPGSDFSLPAGELMKNMAANQIGQNFQSESLSSTVKKQLVDKTAEELKNKFSDVLGVSINPKARISEAFYQAMIKKTFELPENVKAAFPTGIGALIFLMIIGLSLPIRWLSSFFAFIVYEIFLAFNFSAIMLEGRSREIIILK